MNNLAKTPRRGAAVSKNLQRGAGNIGKKQEDTLKKTLKKRRISWKGA
jgi:hypothetical protein